MKSKTWIFLVLGVTVFCLLVSALTIYIVDPCFHYRYPSENIRYCLGDERYQNDGILKHFPYNAMITGTSMTENFKTSEFDEIFGVKSVKTPFSGASFKEVDSAVKTAIAHNPNLNVVMRGLDIGHINADADSMRYSSYPAYLYDDNALNDINYLLNFDVLCLRAASTIVFTITNRSSTTFDKYLNWSDNCTYGAEAVIASYERPELSLEKFALSEGERAQTEENVRRNVTETVKDDPDIEFYYFLTPYSIVYWDGEVRKGELNKRIEEQRILIETLLGYENCHLFSWCDDEMLVCDLDNYKDAGHYGEWVNSDMLNWMHNDVGRLTKDNYEDYLSRINELYLNYDYDSLF